MVKFVSNRVKISSRPGGEVEPYYHHPSKVLPILSTSSITTVIDSFVVFVSFIEEILGFQLKN